PLSDEHKKALSIGRRQARIVNDYLTALESARPRRGRRRTPESIRERLARLDDQIATASPAKRVELIQERLDLAEELEGLEAETDITEIEAEFVEVARDYSERKGISYRAWREAGVPAAVLKRAGIARTRS
ncbi:MAG: hypothetical protein D6683_07335, partial [Actinomyces sp.]